VEVRIHRFLPADHFHELSLELSVKESSEMEILKMIERFPTFLDATGRRHLADSKPKRHSEPKQNRDKLQLHAAALLARTKVSAFRDDPC
jgi:hypothetical protein